MEIQVLLEDVANKIFEVALFPSHTDDPDSLDPTFEAIYDTQAVQQYSQGQNSFLSLPKIPFKLS
jgi:hypothetical protein